MNIIHPEKEENVIICDNMDWHWGFYLSEIRQRNINTVWSHLPMEFLKNVINTKNKLVVARGKGWTCQNVQTSCYKKNKSWACHTQYLLRCVCVLVSQSCRTLWNPVDCSLPGSSVHGILQARLLEWVAISFSRGSSRPRDPALQENLYHLSHRGSLLLRDISKYKDRST